ncbi:MAG TPA: CoA transferase [Ktedonobacteraceae bacterium]|nr:CoA transferase [Ktedonobacteraceae bacterium]
MTNHFQKIAPIQTTEQADPHQGPLAGILVVDLSRVLAGPYCTMMLGDLGATVIKIEHPGEGDDTRRFGPPSVAGESAYYLGLNRNKYGITLDFGTPEGKEQLLKLIKEADVLVQNFRPGSLDRKGLGYEALHALNPGLIYCSISGYGHTGPRRDLPGYDYIAQAESGMMSITGEIDGEPMPVGSPIEDVSTGMYACISILAALRSRDQTGRGQHIDLSLFECAVTMLANIASNTLISGDEATRHGNAHANIVPYQSFHTRDGFIAVACGNDGLFRGLCRLLERGDLAQDPRFTTNSLRLSHREELIGILQEIFLERDTADWLTSLRGAGIPSAPINTVRQALRDEQLTARGLVWECDHPTAGKIQLVGSPMHFSETPTRLYKAPPLLGEDNATILEEKPLP